MYGLLRVSLVLASVLCVLPLALGAMRPFPLGVHFGASKITAAYVAADGKQVLVAAVDGGDKYDDLIRDSIDNQGRITRRWAKSYIRENDELVEVPDDPKENFEVEEIFVDGLKKLKARIEQEPGAAELTITSLAIPHHFNDTLYEYAYQAIWRSEPQLLVPSQVRRGRHVDRMAYHLNNCAAYGLDPADCDDDDEDAWHHLLMIDLNDEYLGICLADVTEDTFFCKVKLLLRSLGAKFMDAQSDSRPYDEELQEALQGFFSAHLDGEKHSHRLDSLHAIVFSGDASPGAFTSLKDSVASILPGVPVKDSVNPLYVGAVGAAEMAKKQVEDPSLLKDIEVHDILPPHDEL